MFRQLLVPVPSLTFVLLFTLFLLFGGCSPWPLPSGAAILHGPACFSPCPRLPCGSTVTLGGGRVLPGALGEDDRWPYCVVSSSPYWFFTLMVQGTNSNDNGIINTYSANFYWLLLCWGQGGRGGDGRPSTALKVSGTCICMYVFILNLSFNYIWYTILY